MAEPTNATHVPIHEYADFATQILEGQKPGLRLSVGLFR